MQSIETTCNDPIVIPIGTRPSIHSTTQTSSSCEASNDDRAIGSQENELNLTSANSMIESEKENLSAVSEYVEQEFIFFYVFVR